ncbi:hypothetical protein M404DRAFT_998808 [Pisolithus tinctorius Marx 270]|uniref:Uncharacterized protein n=1 Tax=Pisolithus tinctorius Marx 270 TaxID=870435 RepID=A0A0C3KAN0_PISTI|nr:hypothetical protein M404DRAFT_998808 [Pisolithus tinctorius Marx 270]
MTPRNHTPRASFGFSCFPLGTGQSASPTATVLSSESYPRGGSQRWVDVTFNEAEMRRNFIS